MTKKKDYKVKRIKRDLVYKGSILDIYADTMELENGKQETWDFVSHRMGAACVVPVLPNGNILLVRQFRPALDRETIELPAGCRDSLNEDTFDTAKRELEEETGYSSNEISPLLKLKSTVAFCDEFIDVYLAENIFSIGNQKLDEEEEIDLEEYSRSQLEKLIYSGNIQDSKTVSGLMAYFNLCNKRK